jgi:hypothetical protein
MKRSIKFLAAILAAIMVFSILPSMAFASRTVASGKCGTNLTWKLGSEGTLTISGTGDMENYDLDDVPWYSRSESIESVVIKSGVTSIGESAFYDCRSLASVTIPKSVTSIGDYAFGYCRALEKFEVDLNNNNYTSVDGVLFDKEKSKLIAYPNSHGTTYEIPSGVTSIGDYAFLWCRSLTSVTIPNSVTSIGEGAFEDLQA